MNSENASNSNDSDRLKNELNALNTLVEGFIKSHSLSFNDAFNLLKNIREEKKPVLIPSSIFRNKKLGIIEATVKYMKEELNLTYHQIAEITKRDDRVGWVMYNRAIKKSIEKSKVEEPNLWLPVSVFTIKELGPMESLASYMKDQLGMSLNEIAKMLDRDNRTVWACYNKAKGKGAGSKENESGLQ